MESPPPDPADHAVDFARRYARELDQYCAIRMQELGIPDGKNGEQDQAGVWRAFVAEERTGGTTSRGITINSGILNPGLLKGHPGSRTFARARLRDRIDAVIAHEWAEDRTLDHATALKVAARTELPVTNGARRNLKAMAR